MKKTLLFLTSCFFITSIFSQELELVKDFTKRDLSSDPYDFRTIGENRFFFVANNYWNGRELWTSDGTEEGTRIVYDAIPGKEDGHDEHISGTVTKAINFNEKHIFLYNKYLLSTDLKTFKTDTIDYIQTSYHSQLLEYNGYVFYVKDNHLYRTDGTTGNSTLIAQNLFQSISGDNSGIISTINGIMFFGYDDIEKRVLYISDGTENGTKSLKFISSSTYFYNPNSFGSSSGKYYANVKTSSTSDGYLLVSDGTFGGTISNTSYSNPSGFFEIQNKVYFKAKGPLGDGIYRTTDTDYELFYSLQEIEVSTNFLAGITSFSFGTQDNVWVCGNTVGDCKIIDEFSYWSNNIIMDGDTVYYESDKFSNRGLWEYTPIGLKRKLTETRLEYDRYYTQLAKANGKLFYTPRTANDTMGVELMSVDLFTLEEKIFKNINSKGESFIESLMGTDDHLYLESNEGRNIWSINESSNIVSEVLTSPYRNSGFFLINNQLFFLNTNYENQSNMSPRLEKYNNQTSQRELIHTFTDESSFGFSSTISNNQKGYLVIGDFRSYIWETDGTSSGTKKLLGSNTQDFGTDLIALVPDFLLYRDSFNGGYNTFQPSTGAHYKLIDSYNSNITVFNNKFYFMDYAEVQDTVILSGGNITIRTINKPSLYSSKGTVIHKKLLIKDFQLLDSFVDDEDFYVFGSRKNAYSLFKINESTAEPILIRNFTSEQFSIGTKIGGNILFSAEDSLVGTGQELWKTDGTSDGTTFMYDLNEGPNSSYAKNWVSKGEYVYFTANDGIHGEELWEYNHFTDSFRMIEDLNPKEGSEPKNLTIVGNTLYFVADDGFLGRELWSFQIPKSIVTDLNSIDKIGLINSVYPNPSSNIISLNSDKFIGKESNYVILDNMGKTVLSGKYIENGEINITELNSGSYHILFETMGTNIVSNFIKL